MGRLSDPPPVTFPYIDGPINPIPASIESIEPVVPVEWESWTVPIRKWSDGTFRLFWRERIRNA